MSKIDQDGRGPRAVSRGFIRMGHHLRQLSVASLGGVGVGVGKWVHERKRRALCQTPMCRGKGAAMPWLGGVKGAALLIQQSGHRGEGGDQVLC